MNNTEYYLNSLEYPNCPQIPNRYTNYLDKNNYLSEFMTYADKAIARLNLGIPDIINQLINKIDAKVISIGGVVWDEYPNPQSPDKALSSAVIYNTLLQYALKTDLNNLIQTAWTRTIDKILEIYALIEEELNTLNVDLRNYTDCLRNDFNSFTANINSEFDEFKTEVNEEVTRIDTETLESITNLTNLVNTKTSELTTLVETTINNLTSFVNNKSLLLIAQVNSSLADFEEEKYRPLKENVDLLEHKVDTFLKSISGGPALVNEFGNDENISVSQKVLTDAFNKLWTKLEDITGEPYTGINMTVTPDYFISEEGCTVHVTARATEANGIFEKIQLYINGTLIAEDENKDYFETDIEITETSVLKCVAKIMGIEYEREKVITHYNSFWLGAGTSYEDIMNVEHVIPITNGMRGSYDVTCADSDNIFIVMSKGLRPGFIRADMNSFEIPFEETTVTINDEEYSVFTSRNTYEAGVYNIDING